MKDFKKMDFCSWGLVCLCFCLLFVGSNSASLTPEQREQNSNSLTVQFYMMTTSEWTTNKASFATEVVASANKQCNKDSVLCGLEQWDATYEFQDSHVVVTEATDAEKNYMTITFYVEFNADIPAIVRNDTDYVLNKDALTAIILVAREDIGEAVGDSMVAVDGVQYSPPINALANQVLIPLAFVLLLAVIIIWVSCYCYRREKTLEEQKQQRLEGKKNAKNVRKRKGGKEDSPHRARVSPEKVADEEKGQGRPANGKGSMPKNTFSDSESESPYDYDQPAQDKQSKKTSQTVVKLSMQSGLGHHPAYASSVRENAGGDREYISYEDGGALPDGEHAVHGHRTLPPLGTEEEDVVAKKKHKKKSKKSKKSKHHHQELMNEDVEADSDNYNYHHRKMNIPVSEGVGFRPDSGSDNIDSGVNTNLTTTEL